MKHTPGPWTIKQGRITWEIVSPTDYVARVYSTSRTDDISDDAEGVANARLIAAAPDLLAAAEAIRAFVVAADRSERGDPCAIPEEMLRALLDAHRKAQGGGA